MNSKKENRKFLLALLFAFIVHIIIFLLLYFQEKIDSTRKWITLKDLYQTEDIDKQKYKAPVTFEPTKPEETKPEPPQPEKKIEKEEAPPKEEPKVPKFPQFKPEDFLSDAALIPGASSNKTILDAGNNKVLEIEDGKEDVRIPLLASDSPETVGELHRDEREDSTLGQTEETKEILEATQESFTEVTEQPAPYTSPDTAKGSIKKAATAVSNKTKTVTKKKMPLILKRETSSAPKLKNVIEGFTKFMNEEGNNAHLERRGSNNGTLNFEEAKLISYFNKIIEFFKSAQETYPEFLIQAITNYARKNPFALKLQTYFKLVISNDGKLKSISIVEKSGVPEYDDFLSAQFQHAAPYPPVPKHLNKDEIIFPIGVYTLLKAPPGSSYFF